MKNVLFCISLTLSACAGPVGQIGKQNAANFLMEDEENPAAISVESVARSLIDDRTFYGDSFAVVKGYIDETNLILSMPLSSVVPVANDGVRYSATLTYRPENTGGFGHVFTAVVVTVSFMKNDESLRYTSYQVQEKVFENMQPIRR